VVVHVEGVAVTTRIALVTFLTLTCAAISYLCLLRPKLIQSLVLRWRDLREPSWELAFLRSDAYLWMLRFVGIIAASMVFIMLGVIVHLIRRALYGG
jgi:hypothetical protein